MFRLLSRTAASNIRLQANVRAHRHFLTTALRSSSQIAPRMAQSATVIQQEREKQMQELLATQAALISLLQSEHGSAYTVSHVSQTSGGADASGPTATAGSPPSGTAPPPTGTSATPLEQKIPLVPVETVGYDTVELEPRQIVAELDRFIIGQRDAKRSVAIAMRNRWRRHRLPPTLLREVLPKNILMIGPTGVGKTEIARRLAKLTGAPFLKIEATKFTEVGFHGRDVDSIIRDLVEVSILNCKAQRKKRLKPKIDEAVEKALIRVLTASSPEQEPAFLQLLKSGQLEDVTVEIDVPVKDFDQGGNGREWLVDLKRAFAAKKERRKMTLAEARPVLEEIETEKLVGGDDVYKEAVKAAENDGIVFLDEIDKICTRGGDHHGADASAEGVQRDLLPLIEGCTISTKYGNVETDRILFIASGAFHSVKPSDMLAELQGRLPIRVELKGLTEADLYRILTEPVNNLLKQQVALMKTEGVDLEFTDDAIREIARVAAEVNHSVENIGARRLHTVIERIMDDVSFDAPQMSGQRVVIDVNRVRDKVGAMQLKTDLSRFVL